MVMAEEGAVKTMLAARIRNLRKQHHMRQEDLAGLLCISKSTMGMYEQGRRVPALESLIAMSRIFGVSLDYLITGRESMADPEACPCNSCYWKMYK